MHDRDGPHGVAHGDRIRVGEESGDECCECPHSMRSIAGYTLVVFTSCGGRRLLKFRTLMQVLFLSTVRIESFTAEGETKVGTGFVFAYERDPAAEGRALFFLVTNKHNVEDAVGGWFHFLKSGGPGIPALGNSVQVGAPSYEDAWHGHPNSEVDIAVLSLDQMIHHEVEPDGPTVGEITAAAPVRSMHVPTPAHIEENLDAIEEILFIGYPDGHYDPLNYTPIARKGITATPLQLDFAGDPAFLIDATAFPGSSGSPVFAAPHTIRSNENRDINIVGSQMMLLGVLSAGFVTTEEGKIKLAF